MPRSLLEFRWVLPDNIKILAHPVFPDGFPAKIGGAILARCVWQFPNITSICLHGL